MAGKIVVLDTSILIDFFRKTAKNKTELIKLVDEGYSYCISAITEYEIYVGATVAQHGYWKQFLLTTNVLPFDTDAVVKAVEINHQLKRKRQQIDIADLFIAASSMINGLPLATLNKKHFERIEGLRLIL